VGRTQHSGGMHNSRNGSSRESDRLVVAVKWGNSYGAKGPDHKHALNNNSGDRLSMTITESKIQNLRTKLAIKAKQEPNFRFYCLYGHILRMDMLRVAWNQVKKNGGCSGIDNISLNSFDSEEKVTEFLISIQQELRDKSYRPLPVKRVYIPKSNGKMRPLGIPTVKDRVVQMAVALLLEPIFEQDFLDCSYGFRPNRSAHDALKQIQRAMKAGKKEVYDADLKGYFDSIPHDKLMAALRMRISDRSVLALIKMWLRAPIAEETHKGRGPKLTYPKKGTPQGGVISPLLANLFLHWFDIMFHRHVGPAKWANAELVRYADDFVILAKYQGERIRQFVVSTIEEWMGLEINQDKTGVVRIDRGEILHFLGYSFGYKKSIKGRPGRYLCMEPSKDSVMSAKGKVRDILGRNKGCIPLPNLIRRLNRFLRGWGNYFSVGYPRVAKRKLNSYTREKLTRHMKRRSQRPYRSPEGCSYYKQWQKMGLAYL